METNMKKYRHSISMLIAFTMVCSASQLTAAETLGQVLRDAKWEGILGTWVDPKTKDVMRFSWKIKDRVIEQRDKVQNTEGVSLIGVNAKTGEVFEMGADSDGASGLATWTFKDNEAEVGTFVTTGDGQEVLLSLKYRLIDADTMTVKMFLPGVPDPLLNLTMKRKKTRK